MSLDYATLRPWLIWPHGVLGAFVLLVGVVVLVLPKGTRRHVQLGKAFYWAMLISVAAALPLMFLSGNWLLLLLSMLSFYMLVSGRREVQRHRAGGVAFSPFDLVFTLGTLASCTAMVCLGVFGLVTHRFGGFVWVLIGIGGLGLNLALGSWRRRDGIQRHKLAWMEDHVGMMVGCFIAASTAFSAVNLTRLDLLPTAVVWLLPSVLLVPMIWWWGKKIRARLGA